MFSQTGLRAFVGCLACCAFSQAQTSTSPNQFNGLGTNLGNLYRLSNAQSRSISPENSPVKKARPQWPPKARARNASRELGQGWKVSPCVSIKAKSTFTVAEIDGSGSIQQIWMTPGPPRQDALYILRFYWDGETEPSIEVPLGDFFACGWGKYCQINSLPVCVNPGSAFNCYWTHAVPQKSQNHPGEPRRQRHGPLLSDQLHARPTCRTTRPISTPSSAA